MGKRADSGNHWKFKTLVKECEDWRTRMWVSGRQIGWQSQKDHDFELGSYWVWRTCGQASRNFEEAIGHGWLQLKIKLRDSLK